MLDGLRAALTLARAPRGTPVGIWGYPEGGAASASAAELASTYAPELNVKGTYIGAPPADLTRLLAALPKRELSPHGARVLARLETTCIRDAASVVQGRSTRAWTTSGRQLVVAMSVYPKVPGGA